MCFIDYGSQDRRVNLVLKEALRVEPMEDVQTPRGTSPSQEVNLGRPDSLRCVMCSSRSVVRLSRTAATVAPETLLKLVRSRCEHFQCKFAFSVFMAGRGRAAVDDTFLLRFSSCNPFI